LNRVGLNDDKNVRVDLKEVTDRIKHMQRVLPSFKNNSSKLTIQNMRKELMDEKTEVKWQELNMGID